MGCPIMGIVVLIVAAAFLVWVSEKNGNPAQGIGKVVAWIGIVLAALLLIGQLYTCGSMCMKGGCSRMMGHGMGKGMMPGMNSPGPGQRPMPMQPPADGGK